MHAIAILAVVAPLFVAAQQDFFTVMPPGIIDVPACETAVTKALQQVFDCGAHFNLEGQVSLVVTEKQLSACACAPVEYFPANATIISAPATACKGTQTAAQQLQLFSNFGTACAGDAAKASAEATSSAAPTSAAAAKTSIVSAAPAITAATSVPAATSSKSSGYALAVGATVAAAAMLLL
ncbi:hypothetical protein HDU80_011670 [Chytriomyces hyalinus]|nr:hypothetical protein HDU80_011670 [Chytriomyces hyalinus]